MGFQYQHTLGGMDIFKMHFIIYLTGCCRETNHSRQRYADISFSFKTTCLAFPQSGEQGVLSSAPNMTPPVFHWWQQSGIWSLWQFFEGRRLGEPWYVSKSLVACVTLWLWLLGCTVLQKGDEGIAGKQSELGEITSLPSAWYAWEVLGWGALSSLCKPARMTRTL